MLHIVMKILDFQSFSCAFTMQDKAPLNRSVQFSNDFPEPYPPPPQKRKREVTHNDSKGLCNGLLRP